MKQEECDELIEAARAAGYHRGREEGHRDGWLNGFHVAVDSLRTARRTRGDGATVEAMWQYFWHVVRPHIERGGSPTTLVDFGQPADLEETEA